MDFTKENSEKYGSWFLAFLSSATTMSCFVFLIRNFKSKHTKENAVVFLCSASCFAYTMFYSNYDLYLGSTESLKSTGSICSVMPFLYQTTFVANKCFCNLIFVYRYKTVNKRVCIFAVKKAFWFSVSIIIVTVFQTIFSYVHFSSIDHKGCLNKTVKRTNNRIYLVLTGLLYILVSIFQTVILYEVIKPIFKHCVRLKNSALSITILRKRFYRIVITTLVFSLSDFGSLITFLIRLRMYEVRTPMIVALNLNINTLCLMCSYDNYKSRLFPFLCRPEIDGADQSKFPSTASKRTLMSSKSRSTLKTIDTVAGDERLHTAVTFENYSSSETVYTKTSNVVMQLQENIFIHPDNQQEIPVSFKND